MNQDFYAQIKNPIHRGHVRLTALFKFIYKKRLENKMPVTKSFYIPVHNIIG